MYGEAGALDGVGEPLDHLFFCGDENDFHLIGIEFIGPQDLEIEVDVVHVVKGQVFARLVSNQIAQFRIFHGGQGDFFDNG